MTASFGIPAGKSLCPLITIKLNLAPLRRWFMAVDALSNLFYKAARPMHLTEWGLRHCLYCSMDEFVLLYYWIYMSHTFLIAREPWIFFLPHSLYETDLLSIFISSGLFAYFPALTILMLVRQMKYLKDVSRKLITISFFPSESWDYIFSQLFWYSFARFLGCAKNNR